MCECTQAHTCNTLLRMRCQSNNSKNFSDVTVKVLKHRFLAKTCTTWEKLFSSPLKLIRIIHYNITDSRVSFSSVFVFVLFLFQTESRNLELWKQNVFISTANTHLRRIIVPKAVELLLVRCVSQARETK